MDRGLIQNFDFPHKRYKVDLVINPQELYIFISFNFVELLETKSIQKLLSEVM